MDPEPRVPFGTTVLIGVFRFVCGCLVGLLVAYAFSVAKGALPRPAVIGITAFFGLLAVFLWRRFEMIVDATFRPHNWS
jgi:hypothetical protein